MELRNFQLFVVSRVDSDPELSILFLKIQIRCHRNQFDWCCANFFAINFDLVSYCLSKFEISGAGAAVISGRVKSDTILSSNCHTLSWQLRFGFDIHYASLTGFDVQYASLTGFDVQYASLTGFDIQFASLTGFDVQYASLKGFDVQCESLKEHVVNFNRIEKGIFENRMPTTHQKKKAVTKSK